MCISFSKSLRPCWGCHTMSKILCVSYHCIKEAASQPAWSQFRWPKHEGSHAEMDVASGCKKYITYCGPEGSNNVGQNYLSSQVSHSLDVWRQFGTVTTLLRKVQPIQFREAAVAIWKRKQKIDHEVFWCFDAFWLTFPGPVMADFANWPYPPPDVWPGQPGQVQAQWQGDWMPPMNGWQQAPDGWQQAPDGWQQASDGWHQPQPSHFDGILVHTLIKLWSNLWLEQQDFLMFAGFLSIQILPQNQFALSLHRWLAAKLWCRCSTCKPAERATEIWRVACQRTTRGAPAALHARHAEAETLRSSRQWQLSLWPVTPSMRVLWWMMAACWYCEKTGTQVTTGFSVPMLGCTRIYW